MISQSYYDYFINLIFYYLFAYLFIYLFIWSYGIPKDSLRRWRGFKDSLSFLHIVRLGAFIFFFF